LIVYDFINLLNPPKLPGPQECLEKLGGGFGFQTNKLLYFDGHALITSFHILMGKALTSSVS
jgi:hypothetical protein